VPGPPKFNRPCIPTTAKAIPRATPCRAKARRLSLSDRQGRRQVRLYSRSGYEWTKRLPALAEALRALPCGARRRTLSAPQRQQEVWGGWFDRCGLGGPAAAHFIREWV